VDVGREQLAERLADAVAGNPAGELATGPVHVEDTTQLVDREHRVLEIVHHVHQGDEVLASSVFVGQGVHTGGSLGRHGVCRQVGQPGW
jgi:hypothetical protein